MCIRLPSVKLFLMKKTQYIRASMKKVRDVKNVGAQLVDNNGENKYDDI